MNHFQSSMTNLLIAAEYAGAPLTARQALDMTGRLVTLRADFNETEVTLTDHDKRVLAVLSSAEAMAEMRESKKINAIRVVRAITKCGLKEAKDAVEDDRVSDMAGINRVQRH